MGKYTSGYEQAHNRIGSLIKDFTDGTVKAMDKAIKLTEGEAKLLCTVDTGNLRNSIESESGKSPNNINEVIGVVYTNCEYAPYVEFGTGQRGESSPKPNGVDVSYRQDWIGMEAQPFMYPALKNTEKEVIETFKSELRRSSK